MELKLDYVGRYIGQERRLEQQRATDLCAGLGHRPTELTCIYIYYPLPLSILRSRKKKFYGVSLSIISYIIIGHKGGERRWAQCPGLATIDFLSSSSLFSYLFFLFFFPLPRYTLFPTTMKRW